MLPSERHVPFISKIIQSPAWGKLVESLIKRVKKHPDVHVPRGWEPGTACPAEKLFH